MVLLLLLLLLLPPPLLLLQLYPYECQERLVDVFTTGDEVTVDLATDTLTNNTTGESKGKALQDNQGQGNNQQQGLCYCRLLVAWDQLFILSVCSLLGLCERAFFFVQTIASRLLF